MTKTIKRVIASISALAIMAGAAVGGWAISKSMNINDNQLSVEDTAGANGAVLEESENSGVALMSAKIATEDYEAYGVSPLADTAYTLTATITPSDTTNKAVTYSVAWKNASSSWANGKTVTDYVTVKQTTTGSLTATVTCLKGFSEQIIITCAVTDNVDLKATCTVDYLRKPLGTDITIKYITYNSAGANLSEAITWTFNHSNTNPTVAFPYAKNTSAGFDQSWLYCMCNSPVSGSGYGSYGDFEFTEVFSDEYTIDNEATSMYQYSVAITQTYYNILDGLGFDLTCSPEEYFSVGSVSGGLSIGNLISRYWMSGYLSYSDYVNIRSALKSHAGEAMFRIKYGFVATEAESDSDLTTTIYNVSFSASSFTNILAESVSLGDTSLVF